MGLFIKMLCELVLPLPSTHADSCNADITDCLAEAVAATRCAQIPLKEQFGLARRTRHTNVSKTHVAETLMSNELPHNAVNVHSKTFLWTARPRSTKLDVFRDPLNKPKSTVGISLS